MENPVKPKEKPTVDTMNGSGLFFLLEVFIDKVSFVKSPCFSDKDFRTCVTIAATAVEQLEICDDDPGACMAKSGGPFVKTFNSGKSCLFTLPEAEITKAMSSFPIKVTVYKSLACGCLPTKIIMGTATIDMTKEFVQSHNKYMSDPASVNCQVLNDSFQIVAAEGGDRVGDIVMFLRISCFGNTITSGFQGVGQPNLGPTQETSIVDRSCNPHRDFQTSQGPCVCGAAKAARPGRGKPGTGPPCQRGGGQGGAPYPLNQDPDNSTPCKCPDGICYCSGPKPPSKQPMVCRNIDQYCLHVPKGILPRLPIYQDLTKEKILEIKSTNMELKLLHVDDHFISSSMGLSVTSSEPATLEDEYSKPLTDAGISTETIQAKLDHSSNSLCAIGLKRRSVSFSDKVHYAPKSYNLFPNYHKKSSNEMPKSIFGKNVTTAYVKVFDDLCRRHTSGTQATAAVNKCLQASQSKIGTNYNINNSNRTVDTSLLGSTRPSIQDNRIKYSDIYFYGKNKSEKEKVKKGVGSVKTAKATQVKINTQGNTRTSAVVQAQALKKVHSSEAKIQAQPLKNTASIQCYKTCMEKKVSIRDNPCNPCPGAVAKGDEIAHIMIGPRELCPVHGKEPCQGPKCITAAAGINAKEQKAVNISTVANPRRDVFELVIRKWTEDPLPRNELLLEWKPPPGRNLPCPPGPCQVLVCPPVPCRPQKCCSASYYKLKNCCGRGCSNCCT